MTLTEADLVAALRERHAGSDWALLTQVANATGAGRSRTCDVIAMSLWPSKGLHLHGFECKVTRSDWQREMQDRTKALAFERYCHFWWIAAPPGCVKLEELPAAWGLLETTKVGKLRVRKPAGFREVEPVSFGFLGALMRRMVEQGTDSRALAAERLGGDQDGYARALRERGVQERNDEALHQSVADFERLSGLSVNAYNGASLAEEIVATRNVRALRASLAGQVESLQRGLRRASETVEQLQAALKSDPRN